MTGTSTVAAFRVLELVSLFIPMVIVMLQFTTRYYSLDSHTTNLLKESRYTDRRTTR